MQVTGQILPTGGVTMLSVSGIAGPPLTTSRAIGAGPFEVIDIQPEPGAFCIVVDPGIGLPGPLPSNAGAITYQFQDSASTLAIPALTMSVSLDATPDWLDETVLRVIQAGVANLNLPPGYTNPPTVIQEMPKTGFPELPFIFYTPVALEQSQTQTGQDVPISLLTPGRQLATVSVHAKRTWHVSILAFSAGERDYYRDVCLSIFQVMLGSLFLPLGLDMHHSFRAQSSQNAFRDMSPGMYQCDILYTVDGMFNTALMPTYGIISAVSGSISSAGGPQGLIASTAIYVTAAT